MGRPERLTGDSGKIWGILRRARVLRLGLCDAGRPYVVPVCFGCGEGCLYVHSGPHGRKMDILQANPQVCFEVDVDCEPMAGATPCAWSMRYASVVGFGTAHVVSGREEILRGLRAVMAQYAKETFRDEDFPEKTCERIAVVRIDIESMTAKLNGWNES